MTWVFAVLLAAFGLMAMSDTPPEPEVPPEPSFFQINTGSTSGTYYPVGEMLAGLISHPIGSISCQKDRPCGPEGLMASAQASEGSVDNVMEVDAGVVGSGLAQADIVSWAFHSKNLFRGQAGFSNLRVLANLYPEAIHLVALKGSQINSVADLRGKRVSIDRPQSGTNYDARMILDAFGLKAHQLELLELDPNHSADMLLDEQLDAFFFVGGTPLRAISDLADQGKIDLIPIVGGEVDELMVRHKFFQKDQINQDTYTDIDRTDTLSVGALWIVNAQVDDDVVYQIVSALWADENRKVLDHGHVKGKRMHLETALTGLPIALHEGAERFYREQGLLPPTDQTSSAAP